MLQTHYQLFQAAADEFDCLIGVRFDNPLSSKFFSRPQCVSKPEGCKAKTADSPSHKFGGLVASPFRCPEAFDSCQSRDRAEKTWKKWIKWIEGTSEDLVPPGFECITHGEDTGLVKTLNGESIFADYDLMYLAPADRNNQAISGDSGSRRLFGPNGTPAGKELNDYRAHLDELYRLVADYINGHLHKRMIQHGPEMMWDDGIGCSVGEESLHFKPSRVGTAAVH